MRSQTGVHDRAGGTLGRRIGVCWVLYRGYRVRAVLEWYRRGKTGWVKKGGRLTFEIAPALGLIIFSPAPDGVEDVAHAHSAADLQLQGTVDGAVAVNVTPRPGPAASP